MNNPVCLPKEEHIMHQNAKIYVAGHNGLAGSAIIRTLTSAGYTNIVTMNHSALDLLDRAAVDTFFSSERPEFVFLAAAKVGGITSNNTYPADFIRENLLIQTHVIDAAHRFGVKKLLFLGSSCIYPKLAPQPLREEYLLTGKLEETNDAYAIAKIAGISMCDSYRKQHGSNFISAMPTNLYGINDNFHRDNSHVVPRLIRKFHEAKIEDVQSLAGFGSGLPMREFLHADDFGNACLHLMLHFDGSGPINVGTGEEVSIRELAETIAGIVGYHNEVIWDAAIPDGTPRKILDVSRLHNLGWTHKIPLSQGLNETYRWFVAQDHPRGY